MADDGGISGMVTQRRYFDDRCRALAEVAERRCVAGAGRRRSAAFASTRQRSVLRSKLGAIVARLLPPVLGNDRRGTVAASLSRHRLSLSP